MDSTLNSLVEITKKLAAAEGGNKKEDDPKYTVCYCQVPCTFSYC